MGQVTMERVFAVGAVWGKIRLWLAPSVAGLLLSIPISVLSSHIEWGLHARRWGLFRIHEEISPPHVLHSLTAETVHTPKTPRQFAVADNRLTA
jgi:membrane glycosyltransferase